MRTTVSLMKSYGLAAAIGVFTVLSAVAALAAFGLANVANANDIVAPTITCEEVRPVGGRDPDFVHIVWSDIGAGAYIVRIVCLYPDERPRAASWKERREFYCDGAGCKFDFLLTEDDGFLSLRWGGACDVSVKGLHAITDHPDSIWRMKDCTSAR